MSLEQKIIDKVFSTNTEYQRIRSEIETNGVSLDSNLRKATIIGRMEMLSWIIEKMSEIENHG